MDEIMEVKKIVRLVATDIPGNLSISRAIRKIKGINFMLAKAVCIQTAMDPNRTIGSLSQDELKRLEQAIQNPSLPQWLLNRRVDYETGKNMHIVGTDIEFKKREDIHRLRKIRAYRGIRHELGLPVRGQRTRTSFRSKKVVGVTKKRTERGAS